MRRQTKFGILAAAIAMAPLGVQAEKFNILSEAETGYFQANAAQPRSNADDLARMGTTVYRNALGWEFVEHDRPVIGAFGPIRDFNPQAELARASQERLWDNMYPIGGSDTP